MRVNRMVTGGVLHFPCRVLSEQAPALHWCPQPWRTHPELLGCGLSTVWVRQDTSRSSGGKGGSIQVQEE